MFPKPKGFDRVGIIQCFLALFFVLWFLILPQQGIYFAWPVKPPLTALFLGAGFMLRSYFGFHLWREKDWHPLRWSMQGDLVFLSVLFMTTWWHMTEMNWHVDNVSEAVRIFCLVIAHVWVLAYTFEPLTIFLLNPRQPEASAGLPADVSEGPLLPVSKTVLLGIFYLGTLVWALLFFSPDFANTRWPWELNAFDARIMSAWPAGCAVWALSMYRLKDWAEIKVGVRALLIFFLGLFVIWLFTFQGYDPLRKNGLTFGVVSGGVSLVMLYAYWKQDNARKSMARQV
ncbi:MAG TPA: hypothetical protein VGK00_15055 [Anaerolineales bacterium]|jgi:hypothetical protein